MILVCLQADEEGLQGRGLHSLCARDVCPHGPVQALWKMQKALSFHLRPSSRRGSLAARPRVRTPDDGEMFTEREARWCGDLGFCELIAVQSVGGAMF